MIVVSNASPIMNLAVVGQRKLLEDLYGPIFVPDAVFQELTAIGSARGDSTIPEALSRITTRSVTNRSLVDSLLLELDRGEAEAIVLAVEMRADLLLLDERRGRRVAARMGLKHVGLAGVLVEAKRKGFLPAVKPVLDDLIAKAGFWVANRLYARVLQEVGE